MVDSLRVLVVETSDEDALALIDEMRSAGYAPDFRTVSTFHELSASLTDEIWDLVLSDFYLRDFTAIDLLRLVKQKKLDVPVIIVSGTGGEEAAVEAMHAGAHDYLLKGKLERLNPAIERELGELQFHREHQQTLAALTASERRFRQLAETMPEVLWMIDIAEQRLVYLSPAFEKVWERPAQLLLENLDTLLDTIHPDDYQKVEAMLESDNWFRLNGEYRILLPDDSVRWISTRSFPVFNERFEPHRIAGLSRDITDKKQLEIESSILSRALEQTADAVLITDQRGKIVYVNTAFEDMTGYNRDEVLGKRPDILNSGLQERDFYDEMWVNLHRGIPFTDIFINRRKNGDIYYEEQTISPVRDTKGEVSHFVSTGKDITERLRAQERLHKLVHYNAVTGLANRILLVDRLGQAIKHARRLRSQIGILCVGFELHTLLDDAMPGHQGEILLREVARRLRDIGGEPGTVAQLSDEEFIILHRKCIAGDELTTFAQKILSAFSNPVVAHGYELFLSPSIGISRYPDDGESIEELLAHSETAMLQARQGEGEHFHFYGSDSKEKDLRIVN
jgi:PAS domain S-box-containing protein/diguanylate cyclase (GGDEF)-like protein